MPIQVSPEVERSIREHPKRFVLMVAGASDPAAAFSAMEAARWDIRSLEGPIERRPDRAAGHSPAAFGLIPLPDGAAFVVQGAELHGDVLVTIPDIITRRLRERDVPDALIKAVDHHLLLDQGPVMSRVKRCVLLRAYGAAALGRSPRDTGEVPPGWLLEARDWLAAGREGHDQVLVNGLATLPMPLSGALPVLEHSRRHGPHDVSLASVRIVAGELSTRLRAAGATFQGRQILSLAGGGPEATDVELLEIFHALVDVARRLAEDAAYVFVTFGSTFAWFHYPTGGTDLSYLGGVPPELFRTLAEEIALDAFPYQVLSPRHVGRLTADGQALAVAGLSPGLLPLRGGRGELAIGDPSRWLTVEPVDRDAVAMEEWARLRRDPEVQPAARALLAPCLVTMEQAVELLKRDP